jgi:hypothetical protein
LVSELRYKSTKIKYIEYVTLSLTGFCFLSCRLVSGFFLSDFKNGPSEHCTGQYEVHHPYCVLGFRLLEKIQGD